MNAKFVKKVLKIAGATALAGLGMFMGDRIADDKPVFGKTGDDDDEVKTPDTNEDDVIIAEDDVTVEVVEEEQKD